MCREWAEAAAVRLECIETYLQSATRNIERHREECIKALEIQNEKFNTQPQTVR